LPFGLSIDTTIVVSVDMVMHNKGDKVDVEIILVQTHNGLEKRIM
jgi:hypothetical protein